MFLALFTKKVRSVIVKSTVSQRNAAKSDEESHSLSDHPDEEVRREFT
jgi:hypothetical protein